MKLYTLKMVGIGPFADAVEIDFRRFSDSGVFLLRGPTGAGKTTILDAIAFALYGEVTKDGKNSEARLRSHYISDSARSEVELVFGTSDGIFRVVREPAFKKNGNKKQTNAKAVLTRVVQSSDGSFVFEKEVASGPRQVSPEITRLLGLNRAQFLQTIILPQGQFAKFLSASSQDRQQILQSIFGTQRFEDYQRRLVEKAKDARTTIDTRRSALSTAYEMAQGSYSVAYDAFYSVFCDDVESPTVLFPSFPEDGDFQALSRMQSSLGIVQDFIQDRIASASDRIRRLRADNESAQVAARLAEEYQDLFAVQRRLAEQSDAFDEREVMVERAQRYAPVQVPLTQLEKAWYCLHRSLENLARSVHSLRLLGVFVDDHASIPDIDAALASRLASLRHEQGGLAPLVELEQTLHVSEESLAQRRRAVEAEQARCESLRHELDVLPDQIDALQEEYTQAFAVAQRYSSLESHAHALENRLNAANAAIADEREISVLTAKFDAALELARQEHGRVERLRAQWMSDVTSSLARDLHDGVPCPVCGSPEHPSPAGTDDSVFGVSRADVESAQADLTQAESELDILKERIAQQKAIHATHLAQADGSVEELTEQHVLAVAELKRAAVAQGELDSLRERHDNKKQRLQELRLSIQEIERTIATENSAISASDDALRADYERVETARGEYASVADYVMALEGQASALHEEESRLRDLRDSVAQWDSQRAHLAHTLNTISADIPPLQWNGSVWTQVGVPVPAGDFLSEVLPHLIGQADAASLNAILDYVLPPDELESMRDDVAAYRLQVRATADALVDAKFIDLTGTEVETAQQLSVALRDAEDTHATFVEQASAVSTSVQGLSRSLVSLTERHEQLTAAEKNSEAIVRLAQMAVGDPHANNVNVPLSSWVLISLFSDVLSAANGHLSAISGGRYALETHLDGTDKRRRHGLELVVVDFDVDEKKRHPDTLSGGETFYVSLALALGLSEIVTGENGGIELKSMFIDEGFGTLDPHTLDSVMEVLHQLRQEDRMIGVISHVEDLDKRISDQIVVSRKDKGGSTLTVRA